MKSNPNAFYSETWKSDDLDGVRQETINKFFEKVNAWKWNNNLSVEDGHILPVVHGTSAQTAWKIAQGGFAALSSLDDGYYGKGIYFSSSALYTIPYAVRAKKPAILVCLTVPGNPYPVTVGPKDPKSFFSADICNGHQSHYVITGKSGLPWKKDIDIKQFDELVIPMEEQILPIFFGHI